MAVTAERAAAYERAKKRLPGLLAASGVRERAWMALGAIGLAYGLYEGHDAKRVVADMKLSAAKCEPVVLSPEGHKLSAAPLSKLESSKLDYMVSDRLFETVGCLRGLDSQPKAVAACWRKNIKLFVGDEAKNKLEEYRRENFVSQQQIQSRQLVETIEVTPIAWDKPDSSLPGRYWLRWSEQHIARTGVKQGKPEVWSATFDITLVNPDERSGELNPVRVTNFAWKRDVVTGN